MSKLVFDNKNMENKCAMDEFIHSITELDRYDDVFFGIANGKEFVCNGCRSFNWGKMKSQHRGIKDTLQVILTYKNNKSRIAIESIWIFLNEMFCKQAPRKTYLNIVGNCMDNTSADQKVINTEYIEIVNKIQNLDHGRWWNSCLKTGVKVIFSAKDDTFIRYLKSCPDKLNKKWILKYPGTWVNVNNVKYYSILQF